MSLLIKLVINASALLITDWLLSGMHISDFKTALLAAILIGLINTFIRPILLILTAPINILTLGLFTFVVNALVLYLASAVLGQSFQFDSFLWAIYAALVLSVVSTVLSAVLKDLAR